jgi:hypothetical protein
MRRGPRDRAVVALLAVMASALLISPGPASAQFKMVHADLPLWIASDGMWPQSFFFTDDEGDHHGCSMLVENGDWHFKREEKLQGGNGAPVARKIWLSVAGQSVVHCDMRVSLAADRAELKSPAAPGIFIGIGKDDVGRNLWLLQIAKDQGHDYLLLAHRPDKKMITAFEVLAVDCPERFRRPTGTKDGAVADHCAIDDRDAFMGFARAMAQRPSVGTLKWVGNWYEMHLSEASKAALEQPVARRGAQ